MTHPHHAHVEQPKRSREEIAKIEIGHTAATPGVNWFLTLGFLAVLVAVPLWQTVRDLPAVPPWCDVFRLPIPRAGELQALVQADGVGARFAAARALNHRLLRDIAAYERALKDNDVLVQWLLPPMQQVITGWLRGGNEDAYVGRDGWLFYRRDIDALTGPGFLDPVVLRRRAAGGSELQAPPQPDPVRAIVEFRDQLAARGIALIVVPAPVKPSLYPEQFSRRYTAAAAPIENPSFAEWSRRLAAAGVAVFDPAPRLRAAKSDAPGVPLYLKTDTHWTPAAMETVARRLAAFARDTVALPPPQPGRFTTSATVITNEGDVARMLQLPPGQAAFPPETVRVRSVLAGTGYWRPAADAPVLFLGDSFANIYSLEPMGWGEAGGLVEHFSLALGLPVDALTRNDAGAYATREMLAKELQRGRDRLAGKQLVVWEFASRELAVGDWKLLPLALGEATATTLYTPAPGTTVTVRGVVRAVSPAPRPGAVPYKDHIVMLHLADLESADDPAVAGGEAVVFVWSLRDNVLTPAARYRPGDTVTLRLRRWADLDGKYEAINRSELDDETLLFAEPNWGEFKP